MENNLEKKRGGSFLMFLIFKSGGISETFVRGEKKIFEKESTHVYVRVITHF